MGPARICAVVTVFEGLNKLPGSGLGSRKPQPCGRLAWQSEFLYRDYRADESLDLGDPNLVGDEVTIPGAKLADYGFYSQLLYGAGAWSAGLRYEFATGTGENWNSGQGSLVGRGSDPFRDRRHRLSPLVAWQPAERFRIRLQYNYDRAEHLSSGEAHSVWLGFEALIGSHLDHGH